MNGVRLFHSVFVAFILSCLCIVTGKVWAQYEPAPASYYQHQRLLNEINFTEKSTTYLSGEWLFYPEQLVIQPSTVLIPEVVELPVSFKKLTGKTDTYGSFVGHFKLPKEFVGRRIGIWIPNQYGAYRMYLNGDVIVRVGEVGKNKNEHQTENAPRIAYFIAESEYFTLAIQASSFQNIQGGIENPMRIGLSRTVNRQFQLLMMSIAMVCGAVLGVGIFTLMFSIFRGATGRNTKSIFIFGIFIVFLALHNLFSAPYAYTSFTDIQWPWGIRLEYLFTFMAIILFLTYMYLLNRRYLHPVVYWIAMGLLGLNILITLFNQPHIFEKIAFYSAVYCPVVLINFIRGFYLTLKNNEYYSKLNLWAVILLCATFIHDFLLMLNLIDSVNLVFISTSLYALLIMFQQSRNYAHHTYHIEHLNNELISLNDSLDQKVRQRTAQLVELNHQLEYQAKVDVLTGAYNRRALNDEIQQRFEQICKTKQGLLAFAMMDVDFFKKYNDHYGHLKGDKILSNLVGVMHRVLPEGAFAARYGGEEFAIVINAGSLTEVIACMENLLEEVRKEKYEHIAREDGKPWVTLSMGLSWMTAAQPYSNVLEFMKEADVQLYKVKNAGRDNLSVDI